MTIKLVPTDTQTETRLGHAHFALCDGTANRPDPSGRYVSLTLMYAAVLFFGDISGSFTVRQVRVGLAGMSLALFLVSISILIGLPVCKGQPSARPLNLPELRVIRVSCSPDDTPPGFIQLLDSLLPN